MSFVLKQRCRWQILIALSAHINFRRHRKSSTMFRQGDPRSQDRRRQLRPRCLTEKSKTYCQEQVNNLLHKIADIWKFSTRAKGDWRVAIDSFLWSFSLFTFYVNSYHHQYPDLNNHHYKLSFQCRPPKKLKFILKTKPLGDTPKIEKPKKSRNKPKNSITTILKNEKKVTLR